MTKKERLALREAIGTRRKFEIDPDAIAETRNARANVVIAAREFAKALRIATNPRTNAPALITWREVMAIAYRCAAYARVVLKDAQAEQARLVEIKRYLDTRTAGGSHD